ncbi:hypothetical protein SNEBB_006373, partial [Seison nebaliae]
REYVAAAVECYKNKTLSKSEFFAKKTSKVSCVIQDNTTKTTINGEDTKEPRIYRFLYEVFLVSLINTNLKEFNTGL